MLFKALYKLYFNFFTSEAASIETLDKVCEYYYSIGILLFIMPAFNLYKDQVEKYDKTHIKKKGQYWNFTELAPASLAD